MGRIVAVPALRRALAVAALRLRSREFKELEIVVLRHELAAGLRPWLEAKFDDALQLLPGQANRPTFGQVLQPVEQQAALL